MRLSLGAGRWRVVRQLLTESVLLATLSGALGIVIAVAGMGVLTRWLANGQESFTLHAELNWHVLLVTLALSLVCGVLYGLAPALQATRPALMPRLPGSMGAHAGGAAACRTPDPDAGAGGSADRDVAPVAGRGRHVRPDAVESPESISLGFNRDNVLLFELNAPQAGVSGDPRRRFLRGAAAAPERRAWRTRRDAVSCLDHQGRPRAPDHGRRAGDERHASPVDWTAVLHDDADPDRPGPGDQERDPQGALPVAVVSELFARTNFGDADPIGRRIAIGGSLKVDGEPLVLEIVGVAASARYGGLKYDVPPVVYVPYLQVPPAQQRQMTYAMRTQGDPLRYVGTVRQMVHDADSRVPVTNLKTQAADIDQTINQEIVFARLCSAFAILALTIACVGLYATMTYAVARRTGEIGLRLALGAGRGTVIWMILRDVCVLAAVGLAIGVSAAFAASRLIESLLFETKPNDPRAVALAAAILLAAALVAGYGPARRASRVDPLTALRHE